MYKKLHYHLSLLFTGLSGFILIAMSVSYLFLAEKDFHENNFLTFSSKINSFTANLEQQNTITWEWLSKNASDQNFIFALYDNNTPISYNRFRLSKSELNLTDKAAKYAKTSILPKLDHGSNYYTAHQEFTWSPQKDSHFYASVLNIHKNSGSLMGIILFSLKPYTAQIKRQRLRFLLLNIGGIFVLFLASYYFTGKLMSPIIEARQKQNSFIAAASHELRTPIAVISSAASAAKSANEMQKNHFFHIIETESLRLSTLADDLLLLNRTDNGRLALQIAPIELDTLLLNCFESFEPFVREHHLTFQIALPKEAIPNCPCDGKRIQQILGIFISNAVSYGKNGGYIKLELSYNKSMFWIMAEDNGIGISEKDKPYIFDRFYRADASRARKNHFGLGLSIAKEIAEAHGGKITVADTPGGGTRLTLFPFLILCYNDPKIV